MKLSQLALVSILLVSCNDDVGESPDQTARAWYSSWMEPQMKTGAVFHSEVSLAGSEVKWVEFRGGEELEIGLFVRDGYEVANSEGNVFMGTDDQNRRFGGSPGIQGRFSAKAGIVKLRLENTTSIDTTVALWTK